MCVTFVRPRARAAADRVRAAVRFRFRRFVASVCLLSFTSCVTVISAERERGEKLPDVDLGQRVRVIDQVRVASTNYNAWLLRTEETCHDFREEYEILEHQQTQHPQWFFFALGLVAAGAGAGMTYHGVVNKKDGEDIPATLAIGPIVLGAGVLAALFYLLKPEDDSRTVTLAERSTRPYSNCTSKQISKNEPVPWRLTMLGSELEGDIGPSSAINVKAEAVKLLASRSFTQARARDLVSGIPYELVMGGSDIERDVLPAEAMTDELEAWGKKESSTLSPELMARWDACGAFDTRGRARLECFAAPQGKLSWLYEATASLSAVRTDDSAVLGMMREFKIDQTGDFELMVARSGSTKPWLVRLVNEETGEVAVSSLLKSGNRYRLTGKLSRSGDWALAVIGEWGADQQVSASLVMRERPRTSAADAPLKEEVVRR